MLKIGEFSKIAQVSIKTLRYYDQMGLFKPVHIDRFTGYRYYNLSQLVRLNRILALKDLDFTLEQIQELLKLDLSGDGLRNMLKSKTKELRQRITDERNRLLRVENRLKNLREDFHPDTNPVVLKSAPNQLIATVRMTLPSVRDLHTWQNTQLKIVHQYLRGIDEKISGPDILIYHQDEYREVDLDVEIGTIIHETQDNTEKRMKKDDILIHTLFAVNQMATTITTQKTNYLSDTYASLAHWTQVNGFRPIGPWRELIFTQEDSSSVPVVEVQCPVMKTIAFYQKLEINEMEPKIITKPEFTLIGMRYFGNNKHQEISELWGKFNRRVEELGGIENDTGEAAIGLCITPNDAPEDGAFEYVAGTLVSEVGSVPEDFVIRRVPEYTYAVFAHKGDLPSLKHTYAYIYESWLPQSGYKLPAKIDFEYYNEDFKDFQPNSVFYIYIPIEKK